MYRYVSSSIVFHFSRVARRKRKPPAKRPIRDASAISRGRELRGDESPHPFVPLRDEGLMYMDYVSATRMKEKNGRGLLSLGGKFASLCSRRRRPSAARVALPSRVDRCAHRAADNAVVTTASVHSTKRPHAKHVTENNYNPDCEIRS